MNKKIWIFFLVHITIIVQAQVSGSGCYISAALLDPNSVAGCGNGSNYCNLASVYVPAFSPTACGTSVASGGVTHNKTTSFILPAGCTATVEAEFRKRNYFSSPVNPSGTGCSNSGMDGSPDALSITQNGGVVSSQGSTINVNVGTCGLYPSLGTYTSSSSVLSAGCSNADGYVRMVTSGGTVTVGGASNRADELITFTLNFSGTCGSNCVDVLPITLGSFNGEQHAELVLLTWHVIRENNVWYYTVEKSLNAVDFEEIERVYSNGGTTGITNLYYSAFDESPVEGVNYYRVLNHDYDGATETSKIIPVLFRSEIQRGIHVTQNEETITVFLPVNARSITLCDLSGRILFRGPGNSENHIVIPKNSLAPGLYLVKGEDDAPPQKVLIY